jgi:nucleotide-binding universal stress UspA family protein
MKEFERILFPVDFSDVSPKIVPFVITMAQKFNAEVHLLFVAHAWVYFATEMYVASETVSRMESEIIQGATKKMAEFLEEFVKDHVSYRTKIVVGDPAEEIISYIQSKKIDLVIMGTHGRKGLDRILFGSVADRVVKMSPVPVMSINPHRAVPD